MKQEVRAKTFKSGNSVALRLPKPVSGSFAAPRARATSGLSPALAALLRRDGG